MKYLDIGGYVTPKHCLYGPRPAEGLFFNNYEWWSITDHLVREQRERELAAVLRAKEEAKKDLSFQMTSSWSNTLASIKTQGNQKRKEKMEKQKQDRIDEYNQIIKNRKLDKMIILDKARKVIFEDKDAPKTLISAIGYSTVLAERKKQLELKKIIAEKAAEKEREFACKIKKDAEAFLKENPEEEAKRRKQKLQREYLDEQMIDIRRRRQAELDELEAGKQDRANMILEGERIHHCNMVEKQYRKDFAAKYIKKTANQLQHERNLILEEEEEDNIIKIHKCFDRKVKKERKEREEKIKNDAVERRMKIAEMMAQKMSEAAKKYEENLQAGIKEKGEQADKEEEEKKEKAKRALEDLLEGKRQAEESMARKIQEKKEEKKWEMMQLAKRAEINEEWAKSFLMAKRQSQKETREIYDRQCKERMEREAQEKKEFETPLEDLEVEKKELTCFIQETLDHVKKHNLPDYPVLKTIWDIKDEYGIENKERQDWEEKVKQKENAVKMQYQTRKSKPVGCNVFCFKY